MGFRKIRGLADARNEINMTTTARTSERLNALGAGDPLIEESARLTKAHSGMIDKSIQLLVDIQKEKAKQAVLIERIQKLEDACRRAGIPIPPEPQRDQ